MDIDLNSLNLQTSRKYKGVQTLFYLDGSGVCLFKSCRKCGATKAAHDFSDDPTKKYGLSGWCRDCLRVKATEYNNRPGVKEAAIMRFHTLTNRSTDQLVVDRTHAHPDGLKTCSDCNVVLGIDQFYTCSWYLDGLTQECRACHRAKRRARKKNLHRKVWESQGIPLECYVCLGFWDEPEHIIPRSLGGEDGPVNTLPACAQCNRGVGGKWGTPLLKWLRDRHPERVEEVMTRVFSYGVSPWTRLDVWTEVPADHVPRIKIRIK